MGCQYPVKCNCCDHEFEVMEGGGFLFHLLHCNHCGKEKRMSLEESEKFLPPCTCGGKFTFDASPRCPQCGSTEF